MTARLLPDEVLLSRLDVVIFRAWSRCWRDLLSRVLADGPSDGEAVAQFARLTCTPASEIRSQLARVKGKDALLGALAELWASRAKAGMKGFRAWALREDVVAVEPPVDLGVVREYLIAWKAGQAALAPIVTEDLRTLGQLLIAMEHARGDEAILITGETGTGKEVVARAIHDASARGGQFVALNCTAVPATLFESELFGYRKGAFTGANEDREGLVEAAGSGTLFLDEIGDLSPEAQPKLLRLLRDREYRGVGETKTHTANARFVAATNVAVEEKVAASDYREDLYFRLAGCRIDLPPLRARPGDIDLLVQHFLRKFENAAGVSISATEVLNRHEWYGNVAELRDAIHHAAVAACGREIDVADLPDAVVQTAYPPRGTAAQLLLAARAAGRVLGPDTDPRQALATVLESELHDPPPVAGDEDIDGLVQSAIAIATQFSKDPKAREQGAIGNAVEQVRRAVLLNEIRHRIDREAELREMIPAFEDKLQDLLRDVSWVPLLGLGTEVLMNLIGPEDGEGVSALKAFAMKVKRNGPLIANAIMPALAKVQAARSPQPPASVRVLPPGSAPVLRPAPGTNWRDAANKETVLQALRQSGGKIARAARMLGLQPPSMYPLLERHGLRAAVDDLRVQGQTQHGSPESKTDSASSGAGGVRRPDGRQASRSRGGNKAKPRRRRR